MAVLGDVGNTQAGLANVPRPSNGNAGSDKENAAIKNVLPELVLLRKQQNNQIEHLKQEQQLKERKQKTELEEYKKEQQFKEDAQAEEMKTLYRQLKTQCANTKSIVKQFKTDNDLSKKESSEVLKHDVTAMTVQGKNDEPKAAAVVPNKVSMKTKETTKKKQPVEKVSWRANVSVPPSFNWVIHTLLFLHCPGSTSQASGSQEVIGTNTTNTTIFSVVSVIQL